MHYRNGREARVGDHVITANYEGRAIIGVIYNLRESQSCNCDVSTIIPGGVYQIQCQSVCTMFHAEDALQAIEQNHAVNQTGE